MSERPAAEIDRLNIRERPEGMPLMQQTWGKLLFMHWPIPAEALRPLIPERLSIDTYNGEAWIALTPFTVWGSRPSFTPPLPWLSEFHELNVRTYVHLDGVPGVWFFSLNANSRVSVMAARTFYRLPYAYAAIDLKQTGNRIDYHATRDDGTMKPAHFRATWTAGERLPEAQPGTLEFFLIERYCLYTADAEKIYRARIFHRPWPLQEAALADFDSNLIASHDMPPRLNAPLLHYADAITTEIWPLHEV